MDPKLTNLHSCGSSQYYQRHCNSKLYCFFTLPGWIQNKQSYTPVDQVNSVSDIVLLYCAGFDYSWMDLKLFTGELTARFIAYPKLLRLRNMVNSQFHSLRK